MLLCDTCLVSCLALLLAAMKARVFCEKGSDSVWNAMTMRMPWLGQSRRGDQLCLKPCY